MRPRHRSAATLAALMLIHPAAALAQSTGVGGTSTAPGETSPPLTQKPPTPLDGDSGSGSGSGSGKTTTEPLPAAEPQLPATGADAGLVALTGAGLLMCGAGLRLRLRPAGA
jgi:LPXTG-motif cell wall-anchored protein